MAVSDGHWSPEVHWNDDAEPDWSKGVPSMLRLHFLLLKTRNRSNHFRSKILSLSFSVPSPIITNFVQIYVARCPQRLSSPLVPFPLISHFLQISSFLPYTGFSSPPLPVACDLYDTPHISHSEFQIYSSMHISPPSFFFSFVN